ncbi:MAG: VWA domain-containing protein [Alphaproteobacteria bacterium]|nr:VWA domain-containing protein [Alphaproteobacteria bacterium]
MNDVLLRLLRASRGAGVRISVAEAIDAFQAAEVAGFSDRTLLKDSLSLTLAKTVEEKQLFERTFDLYFSRDAVSSTAETGQSSENGGATLELEGEPGMSGSPGEGSGGGGGQGGLSRMMQENDQVGLTAAMERAGEAVGVSNISLFTQTNLYARRILEQMGMRELEREIEQARQVEDYALLDRLERARTELIEQARAFVERQLALFAAGSTRELQERILRTARLSELDRRDFIRMRALVRDLAKKLASRYGRNRKRDRKGVLDTRRTMRRNMAYDGIPFRTVWKREKIDKPLLMFLYCLTDVMSDIRSFAFSSNLEEVSRILEKEDTEEAITQILERIGFGSTNYGLSLADFENLAMGDLDRKTTVIILGDARGNRTEPRTDLMKSIFDRAGRVVWLNPEYRASWGTGDSDMLKYLPFCHQATVCNTIGTLERVVTDLIKEQA